METAIPIRNIYYLLCYAWDRLAEGGIVDVSGVDNASLADLYATVLIAGVNHVARRGLEQGYHELEGEVTSIRGKIDALRTARRMLDIHGRAYCNYDELNANTIANRILKSTLRHIASVPTLDKRIKTKVSALYRNLRDIDDIRIDNSLFRKIQLHSNNSYYGFLLNVCELVFSSFLVDEKTGRYKFRDFVRDEKKMARLFETFVFNFYRHERPDLQVKREHIAWVASSSTDPNLRLLPTMETDISIRDGVRTTIIDTKYYKETLQSHYNAQTIHSGNLYQLFAYLKNIEQRGGPDLVAEGVLLYPTIGRTLRESYRMQGHEIRICTVNLAKDWREIRDELLELVSDSFSQGETSVRSASH